MSDDTERGHHRWEYQLQTVIDNLDRRAVTLQTAWQLGSGDPNKRERTDLLSNLSQMREHIEDAEQLLNEMGQSDS
jgi:hypothetical protein